VETYRTGIDKTQPKPLLGLFCHFAGVFQKLLIVLP